MFRGESSAGTLLWSEHTNTVPAVFAARQGRTVLHATGSKAFTHTLCQVAGKGSSRTKSLFLYFNSFMTAEKNGLDVLTHLFQQILTHADPGLAA